jgi:hypothetical protein
MVETSKSKAKITYGLVVLNGEPFVRYQLRSIYPYAHEIIVVEGACPAAANIATPDGHSRDSTLETLRKFREEEDPDCKVTVVTAEDEGHPNGFWPGEKDQMSQAFATRATGNYLWILGVDEFYREDDMDRVMAMLDDGVDAMSFAQISFWGGLRYATGSEYLAESGLWEVGRVFAWGPGHRYSSHRPVTIVDETGRDVATKTHVTGTQMKRMGIYMYHYSLLFPKQVQEKCDYYSKADWAPLSAMDRWAQECYLTLSKPFRVHNVYESRSWLFPYRGKHPRQAVEMVQAVAEGRYPGIELRRTDDIDALLGSWWYPAARASVRCYGKVWSPLATLGVKVLQLTHVYPYYKRFKQSRRARRERSNV